MNTNETGPSVVYISLITAVGSFVVSALSIYLGYRLFLAGAKGEFLFEAGVRGATVGLKSVAPGIAFAGFGMFIAVYALRRLVAAPRN